GDARRGRSQARFPGAGDRPRGEHHRRQVAVRRRIPPHRRRQGRAREVPRAGAERRVGYGPSMARGLLIVISSPSGAGKTTLCRRLTHDYPHLVFSVSVTTRTPRPGEIDGVDYRFVDAPTFDRMVAAGELAEWAQVHGNRYGTTRAAVNQALENGRDVLFDIDWQGGHKLKAQFPEDAVMIWIQPPSLAALEDRLRRRATDSVEAIEKRLTT